MREEYPCIHFDCGKCKKFSNEIVTSWCVEGPCKYQQPSNADRIRAMSDEKLSTLLCDISDCSSCRWGQSSGCAVREWLKQPAEGE